MPQNELRAIWQLLHPVAKDPNLLHHAIDRLERFRQVIRSKRLNLESDYSCNRDLVTKILASSLNRQVIGCTTISTSTKTKDIRLTSDEKFRLVSGLLIGEGFWQVLWTRYRYWWTSGLDRTFGDDFKTKLRQAVIRSAGDSLEIAVAQAVKGTIWERHRASLQNGMWDVIIYYLGFAVLGDQKLVSQLEPLVRYVLLTPPLCDRREAPGNWIILVS
ncbi:MAG: hypothetical protein WCT10_00690 [Patescibacteria group bacterium]